MKRFNEIRKEFTDFIYHDYFIKEKDNTLEVTFKYEIKNLEEFVHTTLIDLNNYPDFREYKSYKKEYDVIIFNLGIMEMINYLKLTCSKNIFIKCGNLNKKQIDFYKKVFYLGLGEFRYLNNIEIKKEDLFEFFIDNEKESVILDNNYNNEGFLIPIGGGKDSVVTIEMLRNENCGYFLLNPREANIKCQKVVDPNTNKTINVTRRIDSKLINLNSSYLNGHIPITGILSFLTYFIAFITSKKYVAFSNESSASEATVIGTDINHQYSKSYDFESDFTNYANEFLNLNVHVFSYLRALNELQITKEFSKKEQYHTIFRSCNAGSKSGVWCNNCPKCLFVYIMLYAFLTKEEMLNIFKEDLLDKESLKDIFIELIGESIKKPFECVGTIEEVRLALNIISNKESNLPYLVRYYKDNYKHNVNYELLNEFNEENLIPDYLINKLREVTLEK